MLIREWVEVKGEDFLCWQSSAADCGLSANTASQLLTGQKQSGPAFLSSVSSPSYVSIKTRFCLWKQLLPAPWSDDETVLFSLEPQTGGLQAAFCRPPRLQLNQIDTAGVVH